MSVPYDTFVKAFLGKITEYDFLQLNQYDRDQTVDGYMKRAFAEFNRVCKYDLMDYDDILRQLNTDIEDDDLDEIVDIVSEGMAVQWFKTYFYRSDNLENILNTTDFYAYSPAELLYRITNAYDVAKKDYIQMVRDYSYNHGDLTDLWL